MHWGAWWGACRWRMCWGGYSRGFVLGNRRRENGMWARLMAVAAVVVGPVVVRGQALADRVPEDALVFVSWSGSEGMGAGFGGSNLKAFLEASNVPQLMNDYFPKLLQK